MRPVRKDFGAAVPPAPADAALRALLAGVGAYCAWCEMPVGVDARLGRAGPGDGDPPAESPAVWDDLLAVCAACDAARGRRVEGEADAGTWVRPDAVVNADGTRRVEGDPTYRLFTFALDGRSTADLADAGLVRLAPGDREQPWATAPRHDKVLLVVPDEAYLGTLGDGAAPLRERALATLRGLDLNRCDDPGAGAADRRVANRTYVQDRAAAALRGLTRTVDALQSAGVREGAALEHPRAALQAAAIRETARALGFWSAWMWTFRTAMESPDDPVWRKLPPESRAALLGRLFVRFPAPSAAHEGRSVFPGTDDARLA